MLTVRLPKYLLSVLDRYAVRLGKKAGVEVSRSMAIRSLIQAIEKSHDVK